jgi:hypothetical protein
MDPGNPVILIVAMIAGLCADAWPVVAAQRWVAMATPTKRLG